ncbi:hypothetical protein [Nocardioides sp.]|uniref:hypothetical protein n=1 Tax=Nocardioides sp. TaxID=35761 RepID=UPI001A208D5E|nr:hypothetical protein [Nocardioides sp.]MBJ7356452.1 hypothetical protein [Nocardioides sp.]
MSLRRAVSLLFVVPLLVACGGDTDADDPSGSDGSGSGTAGSPDATDGPSVTEDAGGVPDACSLVSTDEVTMAVGTTVSDGVGGDGPVATGGSQSTCTWRGVEDPSASAMITVYTDASAADSVREDDSAPVPELGDDAFVGPFASVWAYAGEGSFTAQWYDFSGSDEENLPRSTALALLVREAL